MPSLSTLVDNFNDDEISANWGDSYGGVSETGGQARVPLVAGAYAGYQTGRAWTLAGATVYLKIPTLPAVSTGTDVGVHFMVTSNVDGTGLGFKINVVTGMLRMQSNVDYFDPTAVEITYSATDHLWLRLREDGTNVYWDTGPDGSTWTNRRTLATPAWVTTSVDTCALDLFCFRDAGVTDHAAYDNVNTLSDGAVWDAAATLSGQSALTANAQLIANATASLIAESSLTAATKLTANAAASVSGQSEMTANFATGTGLPEEVAGLAAGEWDLMIEQGASFSQEFDCTIDDPTFTWAGFTARAQIRSEASTNGDLLLDLTDYLTIEGGTVHLDIPAAVTETLTRNGRWDLEMVLGSGVVRLLQGKAIISPEVTR